MGDSCWLSGHLSLGSSRVMGPPSAPPGVQNAILQGQRRLREKFTTMAAGKTRPSKWDTGQ